MNSNNIKKVNIEIDVGYITATIKKIIIDYGYSVF